MSTESPSTFVRLSSTIRWVVFLAVIALATMALLVVFDFVPAEMLKEMTVKTLLAAGIVAVAGVALVFLGKPSGE